MMQRSDHRFHAKHELDYGLERFYLANASVAAVRSGGTLVAVRSERQIVEGHPAAGGPVRSVLLEGISGRRAERGEAAASSRIVSSVQESRSGRRAEQRRLWFSFRWKAAFQLRLNCTYTYPSHRLERTQSNVVI